MKPGAPSWAVAVWTPTFTASTFLWQLGIVGVIFGAVFAAIALAANGLAVIGTPLASGGLVVLAAGMAHARSLLFKGPDWKYKGVKVKGPALDMVEDIQMRFDYARRLVGEVPTGINWREVEGDVATLLWESVEHAARVSALDNEVHEMRYAAPGTPQGALLNQLKERRAEHWQVLLDNQREAELLAREAGNAAAAARVAMARTGSLRALEIVVPSARAIAARGALAEARLRLSLLADAWAELDDSGVLDAERLGLNQPPDSTP